MEIGLVVVLGLFFVPLCAIVLGFPVFIVFGIFEQRTTIRNLLLLTPMYSVIFAAVAAMWRASEGPTSPSSAGSILSIPVSDRPTADQP